MSKIYYGIDKLKKGYKLGSMRESIEAGQVRYFGLRKIDPRLIEAIQTGRIQPQTREKILERLFILEPKIKKIKKSLEIEEDCNKIKIMEKELKTLIKEAKKLSAELKKIEELREKEKQKKKQENNNK